MLRIQVGKRELPTDHSFNGSDPTQYALQAIYNPRLFGGHLLVKSVFTKLAKQQPLDKGRDNSKAKAGRRDIPLNDKVKIRLPDVLNRCRFLTISLFSVPGNAPNVEPITETTIPLVVLFRELTLGGRVATVTRNGLHRIRIGKGLQVHVKTRLTSSSHVSNFSVATLLDYTSSNHSTNRTIS